MEVEVTNGRSVPVPTCLPTSSETPGVWPVREGALLVADGGDNILGLLRHLVQEEVDDAEAALPDVDALLGAELVGDVGEVAADEGEGDDEAVLGGELQTHLEVVLEDLAVEAEEGEVGRLHDHLIQVVNHLRVEAARRTRCDAVTPGTVPTLPVSS